MTDPLKALQVKREGLLANRSKLEATKAEALTLAQNCVSGIANIDGALQVVAELEKELTPAPAEAPKPDGQS